MPRWSGGGFSVCFLGGKSVRRVRGAIVDEKVYDVFVAQLKDRVTASRWGTGREQFHGPVISEGAKKSILKYIEIGKREGRLLTAGSG